MKFLSLILILFFASPLMADESEVKKFISYNFEFVAEKEVTCPKEVLPRKKYSDTDALVLKCFNSTASEFLLNQINLLRKKGFQINNGKPVPFKGVAGGQLAHFTVTNKKLKADSVKKAKFIEISISYIKGQPLEVDYSLRWLLPYSHE